MKVFLLVILLTPSFLIGQDQLNIDLLDNWFEDSIISFTVGPKFNECWGYEQNGIEYAILGSTEGVHFFEINANNKLIQRDFVLGNFSDKSVIHRDIKTYKNYAYLVCDEGTSKLQIVDLSYLPDSVHVVAELDTDFGRVHNLFIDSSNALLYACAITPLNNGTPLPLVPMRVFSLSNPESPSLIYTGPSNVNEVHDCYVRDNIAYLNCGFDGLRIYDFSTPTNPTFIQNLDFYQDQGYNHQGWLTPDGSTYIFADETAGMRIKKCKVTNNSISIENNFGSNYENGSVPHNLMLTNEFAFVAYYNEGLRVYDIRNFPKEIAHFDTYPEEHVNPMRGAWGIYSELPSGKLIVSDRYTGLYLFDFNREILLNQPEDEISVYPNPQTENALITVQFKQGLTDTFSIRVINSLGEEVRFTSFSNQNFGQIETELPAGIYFLEINYLNSSLKEVMVTKKVVIL